MVEHFKNEFEILKLDKLLGHDLTSDAFVSSWFKKNVGAYGLIVCHAYNPAVPSINSKKRKVEPYDMPLDELRSFFEVNSISAFNVCRNFIKNNKQGVLINVSSIYGTVAPRHEMYKNFVKPIGYSMSKAALNIMTKYLATYYAPNFRINTVIFGGVGGNANDALFLESYGKNTPMKRLMNIDEVTSIFGFLLDKKSTYITGTEIYVDGGWTAW